MICVFDKFLHVMAIKGKKEEDLASGMTNMGKKPKYFIQMTREQ